MTVAITDVVSEDNGNGTASAFAEATITVAAGADIFIVGSGTEGSALTISGSSLTYVAVGTQLADLTNSQRIGAWRVHNPGAGTYTIRITSGGAFPYPAIVALEIADVDTTLGLVASAGQFQNAPGTGTDAVTSGSATPTAWPCLVVTVCMVNGNTTGPVTGTGFTSHTTDWGYEFAPFTMRATSKRITSGDAEGTFTAGSGAGSAQYMTFMAAFAETGASGGGGPTKAPQRGLLLGVG